MLVPTNAFPSSKCFGDLGFVEIGRLHAVECTGEESWRPLFGESHGLLGREGERIAFGMVVDVSGSGLPRQPFAQIALMQAGLLGKLGRSDHGPIRHRLVEPEANAEQYACAAK